MSWCTQRHVRKCKTGLRTTKQRMASYLYIILKSVLICYIITATVVLNYIWNSKKKYYIELKHNGRHAVCSFLLNCHLAGTPSVISAHTLCSLYTLIQQYYGIVRKFVSCKEAAWKLWQKTFLSSCTKYRKNFRKNKSSYSL